MSVKRILIVDSVAQLGERHLDRVEVAGSRPVGIIERASSRDFQWFDAFLFTLT
jgi:hypothetical protein